MMVILASYMYHYDGNIGKDKYVNENFIQNMNNKQIAENRSNTVNNNTMAIINKM
jgi:hypothetical protein